MTKNDFNIFRELIETKLARLDQMADEIKSYVRESGDAAAAVSCDALDGAKGEGELKTQVELHNLVLSRKAALKSALERIATGQFGTCTGCGSEIGRLRHEAHPAATHCFDCQQEAERASARCAA
jgi:DnaK suppressor protein